MRRKLAPEGPNLGGAPGAPRFDAAQRNGGDWNFPGKRGDLFERGIDAEYQ